MEDGIWLEQYGGQSIDQLIDLESTHRVDSLLVALEMAIEEKIESHGPGAASAEEWTVLAVEALEREVNNGGYRQFFQNPSSFHAPFIVDALMRIDCPQTATITSDAIVIVCGDISMEDLCGLPLEARAALVENDDQERDRRLDECDQRFFEYPDDIATKLFEFVKRNRSCFQIGPDARQSPPSRSPS